jgi:hypothetical protein
MLVNISVVFGQVKAVDFKSSGNRLQAISVTVQMEDGNGKLIDTKVTVGASETMFVGVGISKINNMIEQGNKQTFENVENKYTYQPRVVKLSSMDDKYWSLTIEYTSQNNFGAIKTGLAAIYFSQDGVFEKIDMF